ncbi:ankyrin repeat and LEM domain-containing protein 2 isoform X1 [Hypanus sabinus]|uniref:ankyrin repeat and LEM domain-containing protein 2 isoform X1 n=1 Tax=Hypanus sabinus TaxID=79690 RepID=UPI0028C4E439|nr:ankyrin repeat and LEM domain-containing protein 2 isoform X1 [Hypanus sabinus]
MEAILSRLRQLTPAELRQEILGAGLNCGPITSTTRLIFEKKLAQALLESLGGAVANQPPEPASSSTKPEEYSALSSSSATGSDGSSITCSETAHSPADTCTDKDDHFGYDVGVNPPDESPLSDLPEAVNVSSLQNNVEQISERSDVSASVYYGVCPVWDDILSRNDKVHVYLDKKEALQAVKMMKGSRFKAFTNKEEAEKFAKGICDYYPSPTKSSACVAPLKGSVIYNRDWLSSAEMEGTNRERANSYKSPRSQDLTSKLRKAVEKGDRATFLELVWSNPRYLIGSGDNPTVLQEGCRYNAMHVAAKENQPQICQLLLETLESPEFMLLMYPDDDEVMLQKRIKYIVDLYLNTPDKRGFDTPLHFACKFGHAEVVNVLCSHPEICKASKNAYGFTPVEVICERNNTVSEGLKDKIKEYLQDRYYVPLLRDIENSSPPVIGPPWSPDPADKLLCTSLYKHSGNPKDPVMAVRAFAGPMSPCKASEFRRVWKAPSRENTSQYKKADVNRGYERVGRDLAHEMGHPWAEYWEFLGCFIDLATPEGIRKVEEYLSKKESTRRSEQEGGDIYICNRFKSSPSSGKSSKYSNSVSVGAFVDSLEEIKNRQNAALKVSKSVILPGNTFGAIEENGCHILPVQRTTDIIDSVDNLSNLDKEILPNLNGVCSPGDEKPEERCPRSYTIPGSAGDLFPISNLMAEFERLSLLDDRERNSLSDRLIESPESHEVEVMAKLMEGDTSDLGSQQGAESDELIGMGLRNEDASLLEARPSQQPVVEGGSQVTDSLSLCTSKIAALNLENKRNSTQHSSLPCRTVHLPSLTREAPAQFSTPESPAAQIKLNQRYNMQLENFCRWPEDRQQPLPRHSPGYLRKGTTKGIFLSGCQQPSFLHSRDEPTKLDSDVLAALNGVVIDPQKFPCLHRWKNRMQSYSVSEMQSWPSPSLKGKLKVQSNMPSSPCSPGTSVLGRPSPQGYSPGRFESSPYTEFGSPGRYSPAYASHVQVQQLLHFHEPS